MIILHSQLLFCFIVQRWFALWLVERRVCIRVCKHGCDVKMFCFSPANQAWIGKNFWVGNSTSLLYLPIHSSAETWKIFTNMLCEFFLRLSWHFKREKSVFWTAHFMQNKNWLTRVQDFATGKNSSIGGVTKIFCFFSGMPDLNRFA